MNQDKPITLTADQVIALVGHGVTQEQLDATRRELTNQIDRVDDKLTSKVDKLDEKITGLTTNIMRFMFLVVVSLLGAFGYIINLIDKIPN